MGFCGYPNPLRNTPYCWSKGFWGETHGTSYGVFDTDRPNSIPDDNGKGKVQGLVDAPKKVLNNDFYLGGTKGPMYRWDSGEVTNIKVTATSTDSVIVENKG